ncbi:MAG: hypothetical protein ACJ79K_04865 [Gemmatimonadaceae bacterium]
MADGARGSTTWLGVWLPAAMPRSRTRPARALARRVQSDAEAAVAHVRRVEAVAAGGLTAQDIDRTYAGAFLDFHARYERALEALFVGLLAGDYVSPRPGVRRLVAVSTRERALRVIEAGRPYADWLPFRHVLDRAELFFHKGRPFSEVGSAERNVLESAVILRNLIAHNSRHAHQRFRRQVIAGRPLPPSQRNGPGYLRGAHSGAETRFEFLVGELVTLMYGLCA